MRTSAFRRAASTRTAWARRAATARSRAAVSALTASLSRTTNAGTANSGAAPPRARLAASLDTIECRGCLGDECLVRWSEDLLELYKQLAELLALELVPNRPGHEPAHAPTPNVCLDGVDKLFVDRHRDLPGSHLVILLQSYFEQTTTFAPWRFSASPLTSRDRLRLAALGLNTWRRQLLGTGCFVELRAVAQND